MNLQFITTDDGTCPACKEEFNLGDYFSPAQIGLGAKNNAKETIYCENCGHRVVIQLSLEKDWKVKIDAEAAI